MLSTVALACVAPRTPQPVAPVVSLADRLAAIAPSDEAGVTLERARLLCALGRQDQALAELTGATDLARRRVDWSALDSLWRARGDVLLERGDAEGALVAFKNRLELAVSLGKAEVRASALADLAHAFVLLGRVGQADQAVAEARVVGGDSLAGDGRAEERLGLVASALGDDAGAADFLARADQVYQERGDDAGRARVAVFIARLGDDRAHQRLAGLQDRVAGLADVEPAAWLYLYLGEAEMQRGQFADCAKHAARAVALSDQRGLGPAGKLARIIAARCYEETGDLDRAIHHAEEAAERVEEQLDLTRSALARQDLGFEAFQLYRLLVGLELARQGRGHVGRAFTLGERARARAHLDAVMAAEVARFSATLPVSPALLRDRDEARERVRRLTEALVTSRADADLTARHRDALWALEEIDVAIRGENPLLARVVTPAPATVAKVQKSLLDDDSVLVSYLVAGDDADQVLVFAIDKKSAALVVLPERGQAIASAVDHFRDDFLLDPDSDLAELRHASAALYRTLLGPIAEHLAGKHRIMIVPHGALAALPFEALVTPSGKFLVEESDVQYSVSATLAVTLARARRPGRRAGTDKTRLHGQFVGLGDPVYEIAAASAGQPAEQQAGAARGLARWRSAVRAGRNARDDAPLGLERLPGTAREVGAIARLFGRDARVYLRGDASEVRVKEGALSGYRFIHIASHGLMTPYYQALALSLDPASPEDGFLMSSEIATLRLDADLVVLSACRTGEVQSRSAEPIAGMALSLRSAGARNVVLSLWSVDDEATAELMVDFYRPLVSGEESYARSLARAKRAAITGGRPHPYYWAPFILHGP